MSGAIQPNQISGLVLWLDGQDPDTVTEAAGLVSAWADKSTEGNDFVQAAGAEQPAYLLDNISGCPAVRFDGSDDNLENLAFSGLVSKPGATVLAVWRRLGRLQPASTNAVLVQGFAGASTSFPRIQYATPIAGLKLFHTGAFDGSKPFSRDFVVERGLTYIYSSTFDGTEVTPADRLSLWINGDTGDPMDYDGDPLPAADTGAVDVLRIGTTSVPGFEMNADLAELVIYDRALTSDERQAIESYLGLKWGLGA